MAKVFSPISVYKRNILMGERIMKNTNRFIKTALSLVLAFAMTFAPIMSSYAVMVTAFTGEPEAVAE